jgi:MarR family transcriptional regulator, transcriptional regulator for hemolysin
MDNQMPAKGLGLLIHDVSRLLRRRIDQQAHEIGLTSAQWRVLASVARTEMRHEEPLNQASLADQMDMEPITLSRLIDRMEQAKLIERRAHPSDRRAHRLYLTEAARPLVAKFRAVAGGCIGDAFAGVTDGEMDMVADILSRVRTNLTGKSDTVVPFAEPKSPVTDPKLRAKPAAKQGIAQ